MKKSKRSYCPVSGKEQFDRRATAERALYGVHRRNHNNKPGAVYLCQHWGKYHITHYTYERCKQMKTLKKKRVFRLIIEYEDSEE